VRRIIRSMIPAALCCAAPLLAQPRASTTPVWPDEGPATWTGRSTTKDITANDLRTRLYQFADDSMQGRQVGRVGNMKGTDYIAAEVKRLGLVPAGDNGTYFQVLPYHVRKFTDHSRLTVDGNPLAWNADWVAVPGPRAPRPIANAEVIFGGTEGDTTSQISAGSCPLATRSASVVERGWMAPTAIPKEAASPAAARYRSMSSVRSEM